MACDGAAPTLGAHQGGQYLVRLMTRTPRLIGNSLYSNTYTFMVWNFGFFRLLILKTLKIETVMNKEYSNKHYLLG